MNQRLTATTASNIHHDGPVTLSKLSGQTINQIVINAEKHPAQLYALTILDDCEDLTIDELVITGPIITGLDNAARLADWIARVPNGLIDHGRNTLIKKISLRNVHDGIVQAGTGGRIHWFDIDTFSGDAGQTVNDDNQVLGGIERCPIEVLDYTEKHRDAWQLFAGEGRAVLRDVWIGNITVEHDLGHPWAVAERFQGVIHTDHLLEDSGVQGCKIIGGHREHGVSLGQCKNVLLENNETDALIRLGDRKQGLNSSGNLIINNKGKVQLEHADATNEAFANQPYKAPFMINPEAASRRGIRNCNPGNIEHSEHNKWLGLAQHNERTGKQIDEDRFCVFTDPVYGIRALAIVLQNYQSRHKLKSVNQIISRYAPRQDSNNTAAYSKVVASALGVGVNDVISLKNFKTLKTVVVAIIEHENGVSNPYDDDLINRALAMSGVNMPDEPSRVEPSRKSKEMLTGGTVVGGTGGLLGMEKAKEYFDTPQPVETMTVDTVKNGAVETIEVIKPMPKIMDSALPWYEQLSTFEIAQLLLLGLIALAAVDWMLDRRLTRRLGIR